MGAAPAQATTVGIKCEHVLGSQYMCRVSHTFGTNDYHCDMEAKICKPI